MYIVKNIIISLGCRILGIVLVFDLSRPEGMMARLDEYLSMCEAGWDVNVVLLSTIGVNWASESLRNFIAGKYHCSRIQSVFGIQVEQYDGALGIYLAGK
jgi:hypothetical protein